MKGGALTRQKRAHDHPLRDVRISVDLLSIIRRGDGSVIDSRIKNVSAEGFLIEASLVIGETVLVFIPQLGRAQAQVRWSLGARSGLVLVGDNEEVRGGLAALSLQARSAGPL